jgi:hypothetical protein
MTAGEIQGVMNTPLGNPGSSDSTPPNRDRVSRFTANTTLNGTVAGSELILYQDPQNANAHGGASRAEAFSF